MALSETGQTYKVKHSRHSHAQLAPAREALAMVHTIADDFAKEIAQLCAIDISEQQWQQFLDQHVPLTDPDGRPLEGRAGAIARNKRADLERLYRDDGRVAPWTGTAHGVLQAVNTYEHHEGTVRGTSRPDRNMTRTINGDFAKLTARPGPRFKQCWPEARREQAHPAPVAGIHPHQRRSERPDPPRLANARICRTSDVAATQAAQGRLRGAAGPS